MLATNESRRTKRGKWSFWLTAAILLLLLAVTVLLSLAFGALKLSLAETLAVCFGGGPEHAQTIIKDMRLPRTAIAALVGACLAMSGGIFQSVTRNNLVSPDIIGVSAGAGLGAVILILLFPSAPAGMTPLFAFIGGAVAAAVIYLLSWKNGMEPIRLVLVGIAISALCVAARDAVALKAPEQFDSALSWLVGTIWGKGAERLHSIWYWGVGLMVAAMFMARKLNVLQFGDAMAKGLGSRVEMTRIFASAIGVGLAGCAISIAGNIGFIGLIAPHMARLLVGHDDRRVLPVAAILGALLTVAADTIGRLVIAPSEIPAGIMTSLIGAPYFLWLLGRKGK